MSRPGRSRLLAPLRWLTIDGWREIDREAAAEREARTGPDWRPAIILTTAVVVLALQEYVGSRLFYQESVAPPPEEGDDYWLLSTYVWWTAWRVGGYFVLPALVIWAMRGERLRDYYVGVGRLRTHAWIYLLVFLVILPAVLYASTLDAFAETYPFYAHANRSGFDFWSWQLLYALQFISLEFFFRGFLLKGLKPAFGSSAIFVMVIPYTMIHFGKPMLETFGAVVAGLALGTLAMRSRSIWGGAALHVGIAFLMDSLAVQDCPPPEEGPCPTGM